MINDSFTDSNRLQNESPYDVAIDMDRELDLLMNKTYTRDIDFQQDLCNLFIRLKDMHTGKKILQF